MPVFCIGSARVTLPHVLLAQPKPGDASLNFVDANEQEQTVVLVEPPLFKQKSRVDRSKLKLVGERFGGSSQFRESLA